MSDIRYFVPNTAINVVLADGSVIFYKDVVRVEFGVKQAPTHVPYITELADVAAIQREIALNGYCDVEYRDLDNETQKFRAVVFLDDDLGNPGGEKLSGLSYPWWHVEGGRVARFVYGAWLTL